MGKVKCESIQLENVLTSSRKRVKYIYIVGGRSQRYTLHLHKWRQHHPQVGEKGQNQGFTKYSLSARTKLVLKRGSGQ